MSPTRLGTMIAATFSQDDERNLLTIIDLLRVVDKVASLECCCPTHGGVVTHASERHMEGPTKRAPREFEACPDGDCDGCPDCLSGQARRIIVQLGGA